MFADCEPSCYPYWQPHPQPPRKRPPLAVAAAAPPAKRARRGRPVACESLARTPRLRGQTDIRAYADQLDAVRAAQGGVLTLDQRRRAAAVVLALALHVAVLLTPPPPLTDRDECWAVDEYRAQLEAL